MKIKAWIWGMDSVTNKETKSNRNNNWSSLTTLLKNFNEKYQRRSTSKYKGKKTHRQQKAFLESTGSQILGINFCRLRRDCVNYGLMKA